MVYVSFNPKRCTTSVIRVGDFIVSSSLLILVFDLKTPKSENSFILPVCEPFLESSFIKTEAVRVYIFGVCNRYNVATDRVTNTESTNQYHRGINIPHKSCKRMKSSTGLPTVVFFSTIIVLQMYRIT